MEDYISLTHAFFGYVVFVTGVFQYIAKKGGKTHRRIGWIYFLSWIGLVASGAVLGSIMITFLGLFGFYYALSAVRYAQERKIPMKLFDKIQHILGVLCGLFILFFAYVMYKNGNISFAIIFLVFGSIFSFNAFQDVQQSVLKKELSERKSHRMHWFIEHFTRMTISFIAALTAFSSIQNVTGIVVANWLWPTVVGTLCLVFLTRKYRTQFKIP